MTTSRIVRGTKGRIVVYVCVILILTGIIACYNNTRIELENIQKSNDLCHQQQENLSTQLQVISDYKQRLEKSLKTEKAEHQQAKAELESRVIEDKLKYQKASDEAALKFNSLQQHDKLLRVELEDIKGECKKQQEEQQDAIHNLESKVAEVQSQLGQSEKDKNSVLAQLKSKIGQLIAEKQNLENQIKVLSKKTDIPKENNQAKEQHNENQDTLQAPNILSNAGAAISDQPKQEQNSQNQETLQAPNISDAESAKPDQTNQVKESEYKVSANVGELPPSNSEVQKNVHEMENGPKLENPEQIVLPPPNKLQSSTPNSQLKSSKASLEAAPPLLRVPTMTPETPQNKTSEKTGSNNPEPIPSPSKKLPDGVVAVQNIPEEENNEAEVNLINNNRYRNVAEEENDKEKLIKDRAIDIQDKENVANEIFDVGANDDINIIGGKHDEQKNHIEVEYDHFQQNDANIDENEDDDTDYGNPNLPKEVAIRN